MSNNKELSPDRYLSLDGEIRQLQILSEIDLAILNINIEATVTHGHGVASKPSEKYPKGTVELQYPFFKALGLDLSSCFAGTLNLSIHPRTCIIENPSHCFRDVDWYPQRGKSEDFLFCDCAIQVGTGYVLGHVYKPDPATKIENYDDPYVIQVISGRIGGLRDGEVLQIFLKAGQCRIG